MVIFGIGYAIVNKPSTAVPNSTSITPTNTYSLPECADPTLLSTIESVISQGKKIDLNSVHVSQEKFDSSDSGKQICSAQVTTPQGNSAIQYVETWQEENAGKWYVQVYRQ